MCHLGQEPRNFVRMWASRIVCPAPPTCKHEEPVLLPNLFEVGVRGIGARSSYVEK